MFVGKLAVVFSHPNHELALFGLIRRTKPHLIFLTDGGGPRRIAETKKGLESIGLSDQVTFLDHTETSFYEGLLRGDAPLFFDVVMEVREILESLKPDSTFCDAVEFYNPVHDMSLPIVLAARGGDYENLYEVPLIYQKAGAKEAYGVQTVPSHEPHICIPLSDAEKAAKKNALQNTYTILRDTLGPILLASPEPLQKETIFPALPPLRWPAEGRVLRYHDRGETLKKSGTVNEVITYKHHFEPIAETLRCHK